MELTSLSIHELQKKLRKREVSAVELTKSYFARIEKQNPTLNCYLTLCQKEAIEEAQRADALLKEKTAPALAGIPIGLKDIFITKGIRTTCASKILGDYVPPYEGTHSRKLKEAGAVLLGKLNLDEFAMGGSNEYSAYGPVKNPWNLNCVPGGSSGGSAAAVAANLCAGALGTDTGGSIRQPAGFCNIVGLKPTYGRVSRYGMIAFASSLDQAGPMTKEVRDAAILLKVLAGHDPQDSTSAQKEVPDYEAKLGKTIRGMKIGLPREYFIDGMYAEVRSAVETAARQFETLGATVEEISLPHTSYAVPTYYVIAPAEASSNLARYDGIRYGLRMEGKDLLEMYQQTRAQGFGPEVTLRIVLGTFVLSSGYYDAYYLRAQKVRTLIRNDFLEAFKSYDVILTPTSPTPAFQLGEKSGDPLQMYLADIFTIPANLAGLPGISLPCGFTEDNLPIGMQLIGKPFDEETLLQVGYAYEQSTEWHKKRPNTL